MWALACRSLSVLLPRLRIRHSIVPLAKIVGSSRAAIWSDSTVAIHAERPRKLHRVSLGGGVDTNYRAGNLVGGTGRHGSDHNFGDTCGAEPLRNRYLLGLTALVPQCIHKTRVSLAHQG